MRGTEWGRRDERWRDIRTELVDLRGTTVRTLRHPGGGTPQLLVHGLGGAATNWLDVMAPLAECGPVLAVDLPGFGRTRPPRPAAARVGSCAVFLTALCRELGWRRVDLHGSSMGGLVGVLAAAREPGLIRRLVLSAPALPLSVGGVVALPTRTVVRFAPFAVPGLGRAVTGAAWRWLPAEWLHRSSVAAAHASPARLRPALREAGLENYRRGKRLGWRSHALAVAGRSLLAHLIGGRRVRRALDAVTAPTVVVHGAHDRLVPTPSIDALAVRRPDWTVIRLPDTGHLPMLEDPTAYLETVRGFYAVPTAGSGEVPSGLRGPVRGPGDLEHETP